MPNLAHGLVCHVAVSQLLRAVSIEGIARIKEGLHLSDHDGIVVEAKIA